MIQIHFLCKFGIYEYFSENCNTCLLNIKCLTIYKRS